MTPVLTVAAAGPGAGIALQAIEVRWPCAAGTWP